MDIVDTMRRFQRWRRHCAPGCRLHSVNSVNSVTPNREVSIRRAGGSRRRIKHALVDRVGRAGALLEGARLERHQPARLYQHLGSSVDVGGRA